MHSAAPCQYTLEQCATPPSTFTVRQETQTALASRQNMWKNEDPALARSARFDVRSLGISIFRRWIISHFNKLHGVSNFYASCKIQPLLEFCYLEIKIIWESQEMSSGNWAREMFSDKKCSTDGTKSWDWWLSVGAKCARCSVGLELCVTVTGRCELWAPHPPGLRNTISRAL